MTQTIARPGQLPGTLTYTHRVRVLGKSGAEYFYYAYPWPLDRRLLPAAAGNYIFGRLDPTGTFSVLYAGETENFSLRYYGHLKVDCAERRGMTHLLAHTTPGGAAVRQAEEADVRANYDPPCNGA